MTPRGREGSRSRDRERLVRPYATGGSALRRADINRDEPLPSTDRAAVRLFLVAHRGSGGGGLQRSAPNPQGLRGSIRRAPRSQPQVAVGSEVHAQAAALNVVLAHVEQIVGACNVLTEVKLDCDGRRRQIVDGDDC